MEYPVDQLVEFARKREAEFADSAAKELLCREHVLRTLEGGLWHTTHPDRFKAILASGAILPEPNIPDSERWKTSQGAEHYPYVRMLGGVSLFDFGQFEPRAYQSRFPVSTWATFVPYNTGWGCAVWIELDRSKLLPPRFISGSDLIAKWNSDNAHGHDFMPEIEAAYLGPVSLTAFKRVLLVQKGNAEFQELPF